MSEIKVGDRVEIFLDEKFGEYEGWHEGMVFKIEPYSQHRSFYWVELDQAILDTKQISVFNPKNIKKVEST